MISKMLVELSSAEVHRSLGSEVGTATFKKPGGSQDTFTVSTTGEQALDLLNVTVDVKSFSITIEPALSSSDAWAYRLISAIAVPRPALTL
jgi:hypothetical protein